MGSRLHEKRMEIISSRDSEYLASVLAYISGAMGDNSDFQLIFEDALENTVYYKFE
ncbi:hypothetical protein [Paenibacillus illinoisensis]|uniref:Uncharacterized protein n=1 Tax=Paenibacillus illinoisensis TaxID=59845 RepID=A0A2W0C6Z6_9BACL|nr:hypothetical protein [Paenibacillus illinoisensis]PYY28240.1 hypothetical protein PIL02S_03386 [Paenibacillus illinoisensis]